METGNCHNVNNRGGMTLQHHIIALGRQFGSGGREIGQKLAQALEIPCYDRELITLAAQRAELREELFDGKDEKAANFWLHAGLYEGGPRVKRGSPAEDVLFEMQSQVIRELAAQGDCIIVGRCADAVLAQEAVNCISLFICAPFDWRVRHRMALENLDRAKAASLVEKMDKQREKYYTYYTKRTWGVPENYDLCVNSARLGIDQTAALLATHYRELKAHCQFV